MNGRRNIFTYRSSISSVSPPVSVGICSRHSGRVRTTVSAAALSAGCTTLRFLVDNLLLSAHGEHAKLASPTIYLSAEISAICCATDACLYDAGSWLQNNRNERTTDKSTANALSKFGTVYLQVL